NEAPSSPTASGRRFGGSIDRRLSRDGPQHGRRLRREAALLPFERIDTGWKRIGSWDPDTLTGIDDKFGSSGFQQRLSTSTASRRQTEGSSWPACAWTSTPSG